MNGLPCQSGPLHRFYCRAVDAFASGHGFGFDLAARSANVGEYTSPVSMLAVKFRAAVTAHHARSIRAALCVH